MTTAHTRKSRRHLVALASAICLAVLAGCGPAAPADREPRLVYIALDAGGRLQLTLDGAPTPQQLTNAEGDVWDYAVHPRGQGIVYSVLRDDDGADLWTIDRDGRKARRLLDCPGASCTAPSWSADGTRIAYERQTLSGTIGLREGPLTPTIWLLDPRTGKSEPLYPDAPTPGREPLWAPAGERLAFYDLAENAVQILDLASGVQQFFDTLGGVGTWDPAGEQMILPDIHFHNEQSKEILIRVNSATRNVLQFEALVSADDTVPRWSPDGEWVAFGRTALPDGTPTWGTQLWLMRPDGSEAHALVAEAEANFGAFAWHPGGGALAYVRLPLGQIADPHPGP